MSTEPAGVLILTQYYHPVPNFISKDVAEVMSAHGSVTVITAHPNYPDGRFYPGSRWWRPQRTIENAVVVWRLPMIPDQSNSVLRRSISYLSFLFVATLWAPFVAARPKVVWVYQTPFTMAIAGLWFKFARGARLVYTCADLWPESFTASAITKPGLLVRVLSSYRRLSNRWADMIICSTRGTLSKFSAEGVPPERLCYVPVWVQGTELHPPPGGQENRSIVYAGNLGPAQQLETIVQAAAEVQRDGLSIQFDLYGTGSSERDLRQLVRTLGLTNVRFFGRVAPEFAFQASATALGQIVTLRSTPLFRMTVPSKLAFCFAAATPVLYGLEGEAERIAAASGGAIAFTAGDPTSLVAAVRLLMNKTPYEREQMRRALRHYYIEHFARDKLLQKYEAVLQGTHPSERDLRPLPSTAGGSSTGGVTVTRTDNCDA